MCNFLLSRFGFSVWGWAVLFHQLVVLHDAVQHDLSGLHVGGVHLLLDVAFLASDEVAY